MYLNVLDNELIFFITGAIFRITQTAPPTGNVIASHILSKLIALNGQIQLLYMY